MAILIPSPHLKHISMTPGERRFASRLLVKLENDYHCWFNVPIGHKQLRPDFIVLHPARGVLILEVKDWKLDTLHQVNRQTFSLLTDRGIKHEANPLEQARGYALEVTRLLEHDPFLVEQEAPRFKGHLLFPWGFGVVFTNISRKQFLGAQLDQAIPSDKVICSDEMLESVDPEVFQQRLWGMFNYHFGRALALSQIDRIRWHLFPEIRVDQGGLFDEPAMEAADTHADLAEVIPDLVKVMDHEQEKFARNLGDGHRLIHGVAGSGKTMILAYRAMHLAKHAPEKPILLLCFNKTLAARLRQLLRSRGVGNAAQVRHFHGWCKELCDLYCRHGRHSPDPASQQPAPRHQARTSALPESGGRATDRGRLVSKTPSCGSALARHGSPVSLQLSDSKDARRPAQTWHSRHQCRPKGRQDRRRHG